MPDPGIAPEHVRRFVSAAMEKRGLPDEDVAIVARLMV